MLGRPSAIRQPREAIREQWEDEVPLIAVVIALLALALIASLPFWLPNRVIALRTVIFTRVNGDEGITVPGRRVDVTRFRDLYAHPAADGRSKGAALSNLFWYWLSPGPEVHQEHLEPGPRYTDAARTTRQILARPKGQLEQLAQRCVIDVLDELPGNRTLTVRLRDLMMPIWASMYYELVFERPCPRAARDLIVGNADDVITSLKCCGLRHLGRRARLTEYVREHLDECPHPLPGSLSRDEQAFYLQGAFFNTAVVQMSEAMVHLLLAVAQHPGVGQRLAADPDDTAYADRVIDEALRRYPLFGIAHRITSADITVAATAEEPSETIPAGSVLCFSYPDYHRIGYDDPERFDPDRWETLAAKDVNFIPFGVTANRPCPARGVAPVTMRVVLREMIRRFDLLSSASHTRSIPNRGPCLLAPRPDRKTHRFALVRMRVRDRWEDVWRSVVQLVLGTYMVADARRKRMSDAYFDHLEEQARCPVAGTGP